MGAYQNMYSMLSAATLGSTFFGYWRYARAAEVLGAPPTASTRVCAIACRAMGLVMIGQLLPPINMQAAPIALGLTKPAEDLPPAVRGAMGCPFDFDAHRERGEASGIMRITRRPEILGLALIGAGGALLANTAIGVAFFGVGPGVCFTVLAYHSDRTQRWSGDLSPAKEAQTSVLPFLALVDGRQSLSKIAEEFFPANAGAAVAIALLMALRPPWMRFVK
eukprot:gnl/TRDRNA2_/TRDRNA2_91882_c0_seq1.p1 gnl/TRDRNA2_/TRDRNA2_91882_c0~~gnl/TRDRNA2_/TRDRNA2_91882_c0_seq1.p1  ORF type:complete len:237 (+),score=36.57 gnl/TRDRNA2_/TRDRNA2_91882_c0_seq1:49-711(+)